MLVIMDREWRWLWGGRQRDLSGADGCRESGGRLLGNLQGWRACWFCSVCGLVRSWWVSSC